MKRLRLLATLGCCLLIAVGAAAQSIPTSTLTGKVIADDAPLPGVLVTAASPSLQGTRTAVTSNSGDYMIPLLPPGDYTVTFEMDEMQAMTRTLLLTAGRTDKLDMEMSLAAMTEVITVAEKPMTAPIEATEVSANFDQDLIDFLPVGRALEDITLLAPGVNAGGPNDNIIISGAMSYDSLFLVNGTIVNENLRGQPHDLFIEDAISETTVQSGAISAEYGHFTGGVVNVLTKSGGNEFAGSVRATLENESWRSKTPLTTEQEDKINPTYEATLGGPILSDKLWFFSAGRFSEEDFIGQTEPGNARDGDQDAAGNFLEAGTPIDPITYPRGETEERMEVKFTGALTGSHSLIGSYIDVDRSAQNTDFGQVMDLRSLIPDRTYPNTLLAVNYNGVLTSNFFLEAQYSEKEYTFLGGGSRWVDDPALGQYDGTMLRDRRRGNRRFWSPTFRFQEGGEQRDHELYTAKGSYFLSTDTLGTHELKAGYEYFDEVRNVNNYQNGSDYRVWAYTSIIRGDEIYPRFRSSGSSTRIQWLPLFVESQGSHYASHSYYVNDRWIFNDRLTFNLGVRYDKNDAVSGDGEFQIDDSDAWSPRLAANWDVLGDGRLKITASYGQYIGRLAEGVGNDGDPAGRTASFYWNYAGPPVNDDPMAPTEELLPTPEALAILFDWFFANGGTDLRPLRTAPSIPGFARILDPNGLTSPNVKEWTVGVGGSIGNRGFFRADLVRRNWDDFYAGFTTLETGQVEFEGREYDLTVVGNTNTYDREYTGIQAQTRYRFTDRLNTGLNYTWSRLVGNVNGETWNSGPVRGTALEYPEYRDPSWNYPTGYLTGDRRHRTKLWATYDLPSSIGDFTFSLLQSFESGTATSTDGDIDVRSFVDNPGYVSRPSTVGYFFGGRGNLRSDDITYTDLSASYSLSIGREVTMILQARVLNVFNELGVMSFDEEILTEDDEDYLALFNPWTETPIECPQGASAGACEDMGAHWQKGENFGLPDVEGDYQTPRRFNFSVVFRF
jgi:outer membrane receptor protein involved in Fe transport